MLVFCFVAFIGFGVVLVLVGANQGDLSHALGLDLAETGLLSSVVAGGIGVGVVAAGPLYDRYPRRPLFVGFLVIAALALGSLDANAGFTRWLVHLAVAGFGIGGYDTLINAAIVQQFRERSARPMSLVHAGASVGAMTGPLFVAWIAREAGWIASFQATGAFHALLAIVALGVRFPDPVTAAPTGSPATPRPAWSGLAPFGAIAFAYVGIEACLTVFAVPYAAELALPAQRGQFAISTLWLGLFAGRIAVLAWPRAPDARSLALAGALGAVAIACVVALETPRIELGFFVVGAALGCVYPVMMALAGQRFPDAQGVATGLAAGAGALGGFALPWATGMLGDATSATVAVATLAFWSAACALAAGLATRR